jgi:thioredoxin 1
MVVSDTLMAGSIIELNEDSFEELLRMTDKLIVVEFYLNACPHCQAVAPIYEEISRELGEDAIFTRVDAERNINLAAQYGVIGTPTFKLFCRDRLLGEIVGETNATVLRNTIKDAIRHQVRCAAKARKFSYEIDGYG